MKELWFGLKNKQTIYSFNDTQAPWFIYSVRVQYLQGSGNNDN